MKSGSGGLRRQIDLVLKAEIDSARTVFEEWQAAGVADELEASVFPGGKRLRPVLVCLGYAASGATISRKILKVAASLELLHTFALIHDDIMDVSASRRGGVSAYRRAAGRFNRLNADEAERRGISVAVLAGDLALVLSDRAYSESGFSAAALARAWPSLTLMRLQAVAGQYLDLTLRGSPPADRDAALRIAALKTAGYSVQGPLVIGARLGEASPGGLKALSRFGHATGAAFQLADDLAGLLGDPGVTGKDAEADARRGSPTWLIAEAAARVSSKQRQFLHTIWGNPAGSADDLRTLRGIVVSSGAPQAALAKIDELLFEASHALSAAGSGLLKPPCRRLEEIAASIRQTAAGTVARVAG